MQAGRTAASSLRASAFRPAFGKVAAATPPFSRSGRRKKGLRKKNLPAMPWGNLPVMLWENFPAVPWEKTSRPRRREKSRAVTPPLAPFALGKNGCPRKKPAVRSGMRGVSSSIVRRRDSMTGTASAPFGILLMLWGIRRLASAPSLPAGRIARRSRARRAGRRKGGHGARRGKRCGRNGCR